MDVDSLLCSFPWDLQKLDGRGMSVSPVTFCSVRTLVPSLAAVSSDGPWLFAQLCLMLRTPDNAELALPLTKTC